MNDSEHLNNTNKNNDASLSLVNTTTLATDEKLKECINKNMLYIRINGFEEEVKFAIGKLLNSIHGKEWKQAVGHFLLLYYDFFSESQSAVYYIIRVLRQL